MTVANRLIQLRKVNPDKGFNDCVVLLEKELGRKINAPEREYCMDIWIQDRG